MIKCKYVFLGWLGILVCSFGGASGAFAQALKVACIGNSVTYGLGLKDPATESYPFHLTRQEWYCMQLLKEYIGS